MTAKTIHLAKIKEHLQELKDAVAIGIEIRPSTIGFHTSACSIDLLEVYLHKTGKIPIGAQIKHDWFQRPKDGQKIMPLAERKIKTDFANKKEIFDFLYSIEESRNKLIYGNATHGEIKQIINIFYKYKQLLKEMLEKEGEEIEDPN